MSSTIFKYTLEITDTQELRLPKGSQILSVGQRHALIGFAALTKEAFRGPWRSCRTA